MHKPTVKFGTWLIVLATGVIGATLSTWARAEGTNGGERVSSQSRDLAESAAEVVASAQRLNAASFADREAARGDLQRALARQLASLLIVDDAEAAARGRGVVKYESSAGAWALAILATAPESEAKDAIALAFSKDVAPLMADVMSEDVQIERAALAKIAATNDPRVPAFLAAEISLGNSVHAAVAIDVAWDQKPSDETLRALWNRTVRGMWADGTEGPTVAIPFRGAHVQLQPTAQVRPMDTAYPLAAGLLLAWNDPRTGDAFRKYIRWAAKSRELQSRQLQQRLFIQLAQQFAVREAVTLAAQLATGERTSQTGGGAFAKSFSSNRTQMLGLLITLTRQDPKDYGLIGFNGGGMQLFWSTATEKQEVAAVEKARAWWAQHGGDYPELASGPSTLHPEAAPERASVR